jgi:acyl-CoA dehydrogenase
MIDFEIEPQTQKRIDLFHTVAEQMMRPISREYDEREHDKPWDFLNAMWAASTASGGDPMGGGDANGQGAVKMRNLYTVATTEELCWGDAGLFLSIPNAGLGGAAVMAAGTPEQKQRFLAPFRSGKPKWGAMAITEPGCGSDSAAVTTTATRDGDHWVLNGNKIFCTSGWMAVEKSEGFVVVWATVDKSAGRAGIKPFVVEHGTPGMSVARLEKKLGIRVSDTAALVFDNCRVPADHLLGSAEVRRDGGGFKDVMATFDATRPIVAAMAIGVGRAALDFVREFLAEQKVEIRYGLSPRRLSAVERDFMEMEDRHGNAQQPGGLDGQGQGGPRGHADHAESGRVAGAAWLLAPLPGREMDARREDQRHLRGHAADQHDHRRAAHPGVLEQGAELNGTSRGPGRTLLRTINRNVDGWLH